VPRPIQLLLGIAGLVALALLGRWAMERESGRVEPRRGPVVLPEKTIIEAPGRKAPPARSVKFHEVPAEAAGVDFRHTWGGGGMNNLVKASGGGVTLFDYDGDGDADLYFSQGAFDPVAAPGVAPAETPRNRLYRNEGAWKFMDVTDASGLGDTGYGMGAAAADYDGDGDQDLYVANYGPDRLYRNDGGKFTDVTKEAGIAVDGFSVGAAWGDADGDGNLDLLVCGYVVFDPAVKASGPGEPFPGPSAYRGEPTRLLLGRADGTFEDATRRAGLWTTEAKGMSVAFADLLGNGAPQLIVSSDATPNFVYERRDGARWVETAFRLGLAYSGLGQARSSMGIAVLDFDRDGRPDIAIPDGSGGCLYRNAGGLFEDVGAARGISGAMAGRTGWSATPVDFDLDGWPDLVVTCGGLHVLKPERPVLFRNAGNRFEDATAAAAFARDLDGRGCAAADLDGDGDPDLVIATLGGRPLLLRNEADGAHRSLVVRCEAKGRNRDAIGAVVEVETAGLVQREEVRTTQGYLSGSGPDLLFGLGEAARAARVRVRFPGGAVLELKDVPAGRVVVRE